MLSVLFGEQFDNFRHILEFYLSLDPVILDITYGHGKLWQNINRTKTTSCIQVVISNDIDPQSPAKYHYPFDQLHLIVEKHGLFDAIIYDPPYKYDSPSYIFWQRSDVDWQPNKTEWTIRLQKESIEKLNNIVPLLIKKDGFFIVKIMDTRLNGKLILNHKIIIDALTNFELADLIIYVRLGVGVFKNSKSTQTTHGFYLVFKPKENKTLD